MKKTTALVLTAMFILVGLNSKHTSAETVTPTTYSGNWKEYAEAILAAKEAERVGNIQKRDQALRAAQLEREEFERQGAVLKSQQDALTTRQAELMVQVNKAGSDFDGAQVRNAVFASAAGDEQRKIDSLPWYKKPLSWFWSTPNIDARKKAAQEMAEAKSQADSFDEKAKGLQSDVEKYSKSLIDKHGEWVAAQGKVESANEELEKAKAVTIPRDKILFDHAQQLFDQQERNYYDARLLLTDVRQLKLGTEQLKIAMGDRINNTLLGQHINNQIRKLAEKACEIQDRCAAKRAGEIPGMVNEILSTKSGSSKESGSNSKGGTWTPVDIQRGDAAGFKNEKTGAVDADQ